MLEYDDNDMMIWWWYHRTSYGQPEFGSQNRWINRTANWVRHQHRLASAANETLAGNLCRLSADVLLRNNPLWWWHFQHAPLTWNYCIFAEKKACRMYSDSPTPVRTFALFRRGQKWSEFFWRIDALQPFYTLYIAALSPLAKNLNESL